MNPLEKQYIIKDSNLVIKPNYGNYANEHVQGNIYIQNLENGDFITFKTKNIMSIIDALLDINYNIMKAKENE